MLTIEMNNEAPRNFQITLKNYRCFQDKNPATIKFSDGITAFLGINNSGKSSLLRFFHESKSLWSKLIATTHYTSFYKGEMDIHFLDLNDQSEIYCDLNNRPLEIEVKIDKSELIDATNQISKILIRSDRAKWKAEYYIGDTYNKVTSTRLLHETNTDVIQDSETQERYSISKMRALMKTLTESLYIGPFRNVVNQGGGNYFGLAIGTSFVGQWGSWKGGDDKSRNIKIYQITKEIREIFKFESLEINSSSDAQTLQVVVDNKPYKIRELGAGLSQFIVVLGNVVFNQPKYLFIDEPELNLHPSLQLRFLTALANYTENTVVFATHSVGLARSSADNIYSLTLSENGSRISPFEQTANYIEFLGELNYSAYRDFGYDKVLFVEGANDIKTIQEFLRKLRKDTQVVVLPLGGNALANKEREHELAELSRLNANVFIIVDSERESKSSAVPKIRVDFGDLCRELGYKVCITEYRAIENYLSDSAIKSVFGDQYSSLAPYEKLSESNSPWSKNLSWKVAREMQFDEIKSTDLGKFLDSI